MSKLLMTIGERVRARRKELGLSRAALANLADVSARFLAQLESGSGNISIQRLTDVSHALRLPLSVLLVGLGYQPASFVALVGLRGAGKSTVGTELAAGLNWDFIELDQLIVDRAGVSLSEIFEIGGADYYRSLERELLQEVSVRSESAVLAAGGSIVSASENWTVLRQMARTVWLFAKPEHYLQRVQAQGDFRPMKGRHDALSELRQILSARQPSYAQAELHIDTDLYSPQDVVKLIQKTFLIEH
ncbi:MAG: shikimate kinase [Myxococcota bacterium]|nr:shikimate kinase [Myxococcota bacterium]